MSTLQGWSQCSRPAARPRLGLNKALCLAYPQPSSNTVPNMACKQMPLNFFFFLLTQTWLILAIFLLHWFGKFFLASESPDVWIVTFIDVFRVSKVVGTHWAGDSITFLSAIMIFFYWNAAFCGQTRYYFCYIFEGEFLLCLGFNMLALSLECWPVYSICL